MKKFVAVILTSAILVSCGPAARITKGERYSKMYEEQPVVLLVMPPINNSSSVEAKDLLYTSISKPLAEAGYYVISPLLSMDILRAESAYDAEMFAEASLEKFGQYFGADAVVFSQINSWTKKGFGIQTNLRYFIRSAKTGETLFDRSCDLYLDCSENVSGNNSGLLGLVADLAASAVNTALTEHIKAARMANYFILNDIPAGKYNPAFMQDQEMEARPEHVKETVK